MRTTEIWKDSLRSIKSIWLYLVSNFPAQDFPMCFQSPLFKRSNFRTCWTSCSSYWLHRETRFWKPKCFVRDRRARTETAVIGWGKAVVYQKSAALGGKRGCSNWVWMKNTEILLCGTKKPFEGVGGTCDNLKAESREGLGKGGCSLKSTSCRRFTLWRQKYFSLRTLAHNILLAGTNDVETFFYQMVSDSSIAKNTRVAECNCNY